jgi:hypothetical protein
LPLIVGLAVPLMMLGDLLERHINGFLAFSPAMLFPALALYAGCLLIWKSTITWTFGRRIGVFAIAAVTVALLLAAPPLIVALGAANRGTLFMLVTGSLSVTGIALWLSSLICYDSPEPAQVLCPSCGYDLRGQRECRCPECGQQYTLGDLARPREG